MTKEELKKEIKFYEEKVNELFKRDGFIEPILFVKHDLEKEGKIQKLTAIIPIEQIEHRDKIMYAAGTILKKMKGIRKVNGIIFVSEAWVSTLSKEEGEKIERGEKGYSKPSEDPKRKDVVMISGMTDNREFILSAYEVKNRDDKDKRKMIPMEKMSGAKTVESYLLDCFWKGLGTIIKI